MIAANLHSVAPLLWIYRLTTALFQSSRPGNIEKASSINRIFSCSRSKRPCRTADIPERRHSFNAAISSSVSEIESSVNAGMHRCIMLALLWLTFYFTNSPIHDKGRCLFAMITSSRPHILPVTDFLHNQFLYVLLVDLAQHCCIGIWRQWHGSVRTPWITFACFSNLIPSHRKHVQEYVVKKTCVFFHPTALGWVSHVFSSSATPIYWDLLRGWKFYAGSRFGHIGRDFFDFRMSSCFFTNMWVWCIEEMY